MKTLLYIAILTQFCLATVQAAYSPEVLLPEEKLPDARKGTSALKSLPRAVRQAYIAEKLGLCYLPSGGKAYQNDPITGTVEGVAARYYYAYTAAVFVGSDGRTYDLRDTQKKKDARPKDAEAVKKALRAIYECSPEGVFAGLSDEITQMCLKTAKNRLAVMPQVVRDCFLAEMGGLLYLPEGKSAYTGKKGSTRANGTDVNIEYEIADKGARFVDSNGVEQDYYDVVNNQRKSREVYGDAWGLAALCTELVGKEDVLQLYPDEMKAMRKYRKDVETYGAPKVDKKQQADNAISKKPEVTRCVSALRSMPRQMREAYLAERMGLCFMSNGEEAYDDNWVITTRYGLRVRHYAPKYGAHFIGSNGKEYGLHDSMTTVNKGKQADRLQRLSAEAVRGLFGSDGEAVTDAFSKDIAEMAARTAKLHLSTMPAALRAAFIAEAAELMFMSDGRSPYTGQTGKWKVPGCDREAEWKILEKEARYVDAAGREQVQDVVVNKHWDKYGSSWRLAKWCIILAGEDALYEMFADDVAALRKQAEKRVKK